MYEYTVLWSGKYYQHWENELHNHSYYQIISVLKGSGQICIGEELFPLSERSIYLIHPHVPHAILRQSPEDHPQLMDIKFSIQDGPLAQDVDRLPARLEEKLFSKFQYYFDRILRESGAGFAADTPEKVCGFLCAAYEEWKRKGCLEVNADEEYVARFSRRGCAEKLAEILSGI